MGSIDKTDNKIIEYNRDKTTAFGETKNVGIELLESSSGIHEPNSRFVFLHNGSPLTFSEIDNQVNHNPPTYEVSVQNSGETYVMQGKERNTYTAGFEAVCGCASYAQDNGGEGNYVPEGVKIEEGYALFDEGNKQGIVVEFTADDVRLVLYKDNNEVNSVSLEDGEWRVNPFEDEKLNFTTDTFSVKRFEFDLYGAGDAKFNLRTRDENGDSQYIHCATISRDIEPILSSFNLHSATKITATEDLASPFNYRVGDRQFFNRASIKTPTKQKFLNHRDVTVDTSFADDTLSVLRVYRISPRHKEVRTEVDGLKTVGSFTGDLELREIHPDNLDFGTVDPDDDSNWITPEGLNPRDNSVEVLNVDENTVALQTYTDNKGIVRPHGWRKKLSNVVSSKNQDEAFNEPDSTVTSISEYYYTCLCGEVQNASQTFPLVKLSTNQRW